MRPRDTESWLSPLRQVGQGLLASMLVIGLAMLAALGMPVQAEMGWVTVVLNSMVPTQMVMTLFWRGQYPAVLAGLRQPWRGLLLVLLNGLAGAVVSVLAVWVWGAGQMQATLFVIMPLIISIPLTLAQIVLFQG